MGTRLFVGGLPFKTGDQELYNLFEQGDSKEGGNLQGCGEGTVKSAEVKVDRDTGRSRGFAFVEMNSEAYAKKAVELFNKQIYGGRELRVDGANPGPDRNTAYSPRSGARGDFRSKNPRASDNRRKFDNNY